MVKVWFFVSLVEKYYTKFTCNVLFGNIIKNKYNFCRTYGDFYLWGSFIRGSPLPVLFRPSGTLLRKISMNYQEHSLLCLYYFVPLGLVKNNSYHNGLPPYI